MSWNYEVWALQLLEFRHGTTLIGCAVNLGLNLGAAFSGRLPVPSRALGQLWRLEF